MISMEENLEKLVQDLKMVEKPSLLTEKKKLIRAHLIGQLSLKPEEVNSFGFARLIKAILLSVKDFKLDNFKKVSLKERILDAIQIRSQRRFFFADFFSFGRRLVSGVLVFALIFFSYSFLSSDPPVAMASNLTMIDSFDGDVMLERDGQQMDIYLGLQIFEDDKIRTGNEGTVVVRYFDDSVSRLASNSELIINKLTKGDLASKSYIEVSVLSGNLWSKVVNLVQSSSMFTVRASDVYATTKRAAFNVKVENNGDLEIGVFQHNVNVKTNGDDEKIFSGNKVVVPKANKHAKAIKSLNDKEKNQEWIKTNLEDDKTYLTAVEQELLDAKLEAIGVSESEDFSFETSLTDETLVFLTFDDVKKAKLRFGFAEQDFIAAQVKLGEEDLDEEQSEEISEVMHEYYTQVKGFYELIEEVKKTDLAYAQELESFIKDKISSQKAGLSFALPAEPTYEAKKVLEEAELLAIKNQTDLVEIKADRAVEKLYLMEEAKASGDLASASSAEQEYKQEISGMMEIAGSIDQAKLEPKKQILAEKLNENIEILDAANLINEKELTAIKADVAQIFAVDGVPKGEIKVPATGGSTSGGTVKEPAVKEPEIQPLPPLLEVEPVQDAKFGAKVKGDKVLAPLF